MNSALAAAIATALSAGGSALREGEPLAALVHFERAHVLGQWHTVAHLRAHWGMLVAGVALRDYREVAGQLYRIVGAVLLTPVGCLPVGNSGRARVSALSPMPIDQLTRSLLVSDPRSSKGLGRAS